MAPFRATPRNLTVDASLWTSLTLSVMSAVMTHAEMFAHGLHATHATFKLSPRTLTHTLAKSLAITTTEASLPFLLPLLITFYSALGLFIIAVLRL